MAYYLRTLVLTVLALNVGFGCSSSDDEDDDESMSTVTIRGSSSSLTLAATSGIDPDTVSIKIRKVAVSESNECTSLQTIFSTETPEYQNFSGSPDLGSGEIADGSYPCVVIEMSDQVKFTPSENSDNSVCESGTEYTLDVCASRGDEAPTTTYIDGTTATCSDADGVEDYVGLYLSTLSTVEPQEAGEERSEDEEGNAFEAPTAADTTNGFKLVGAFVVSGASQGTFTADFSGRIAEEEDDDGEGRCGMESPNWGFN